MAMRLSGLISGMDTDAMIEELVSAYSTKRDKIYRNRKTLEYKQDAWKELNSKIYSFYTKSLANMKLTSNYNLKTVKSSNEDKASVTASNIAVNGTQELKIKQFAKTGYLTGAKIQTEDGEDVTASTKLSALGISKSELSVTVGGETKTLKLTADMTVKELKAELGDMGLSVNFDESNSRFFISSKTGGKDADFTITGADEEGMKSLAKLGLSTVSTATVDKYKAYVQENTADKVESDAKTAYMKQLLREQKTAIQDSITAKTEAQAAYAFTDDETTEYDALTQMAADELTTEEQTRLDELAAKKANYDAIAGEIEVLNSQVSEIDSLITEGDLSNMETYATTTLGMTVDYSESNADYQAHVDTYQAKVDYAQDMVDYAALYDKSKTTDGLTTDEQTKLDALKAKYGELYSSGAVKIDGQDAIIELNGAEFTSNSNTLQINGLTIQAKGLTVEGEIITLTTDTDVDAIYNKIKDFLKEYNELMTEMSTKYNADSAGDYEPLTEAEEEELSETQIEKWEKILTTAALRRDSTLGSAISSMKSAMMKSYEIDGKSYSLSTFGIKTLGYFVAEDNEKGNYHIDGDADDENTSANTDKLRAALVSDPENTVEFFASLMKDLYQTLSDKMSKSTSTSSAFKIYNDKSMQTQYDKYTDKLDEWEDKIEDYRDRYVKKFSNMETAMAKLQSQQSSLASFFGTSS